MVQNEILHPTQALAVLLALKCCAFIEEILQSYTDFVFCSVQDNHSRDPQAAASIICAAS